MRLRSRFRDSFVATRGKPPFFYGETTTNGFSSSSSSSSPLVALVFSAFLLFSHLSLLLLKRTFLQISRFRAAQ